MGLMSTQISTKRLVPLCRQLATTHEAGIPILRSLEMASCTGGDKKVRLVMRAIHDDIRAGKTLGEAARAQEKFLPPMFIDFLAAGEHGGKLDVSLQDLASYYEDRATMQRAIAGSLVYPGFQLLAAWLLGSFALGLVGKMKSVFTSGKDFDFAGYINEYLAFLGASSLAMAGAGLAVIVLMRLGWFPWLFGAVSTHLWPFSRVTQKFALARFFRSMALLIGSGVPLKACITNSASTAANPYIQKDLMQAVPRVERGDTLVRAFSDCRCLTPLAREMLVVGEESGNLDDVLMRVSRQHNAEAVHALQVAAKAMNILITLLIGGLVGYIVISFYSNYINIAMQGLQ